MSGFEIAGAVLGAIPIAITALDKYKEANKRLAFWWGIRQEHKRFSSDLEFQRCNFELNLKQLLLPLLVDDDSIRVLLANPGGDEWKRPETEEALKKRLAGSYEHYLSIMEGLQKAVGMLNQGLALESPAVQEAVQNPKKSGPLSKHFSRDSIGYQMYRLKLSADGGSKARKLLDELTQRNEQLEKLLKQTDKVAELSQRRDESGLTKTAVKLDAAMLSFWKKATALYKILQTTWSSCSCSGNHITNMLLEHQTVHEKECFDIMFATSNSTGSWKVRRALVTLGENRTGAIGAPKSGTDVLAVKGPAPADCGNTAAHQPGHRQIKALKSAMRVKSAIGGGQAFVDPCPTVAVGSLAAATVRSLSMEGGHARVKIESSITASLGQPTVAATKRITNLCESLRKAAPDESQCAGFLHDDEDEGCKYYLYPEANDMVLRHKFISLHQLISEEELPPLGFKQRLFISLALASSFLKLLESPWIPHQWTKEDIIFFPDPEDPGVFILEKPHVKGLSAEDEHSGAASSKCHAARSPTREEKRQESLSQLGIVLEELCFRCSIEKRRAQRGHLAPRSRQERLDTDVALGIGWLRDISKEAAGLEYSEAVRWCLVDNRVAAGGSDSWRREMLAHVVRPLERSYRQFPLDN